jgi:UDP-3-O-acyl-N-acetylglucosamine deacetylase
MTNDQYGRILGGDEALLTAGRKALDATPVDLDLEGDPIPQAPGHQRTIGRQVSVQGPGTFLGKATRTLTFEPTHKEGWWFDRTDLPGRLPVKVSVRNVWNTGQIVSNIVLRSGPPDNYMRLTEHIIFLRMATGIHNLLIRADSGDPPLLPGYGREILDALDSAGVSEGSRPVRYVTVKEKVTLAGHRGDFLTLSPHEGGAPAIHIDCGIDFKTAIGRQRIRFPVTENIVRFASDARTNTTLLKMLYCRTVGLLFADVRNLGYNRDNVLIAGRLGYVNEPRHDHNGKSLEAVWHRAVLDLLAAVALIDEGLFIGHITSFKAGHRLDVAMIRQLYARDLLMPVGT